MDIELNFSAIIFVTLKDGDKKALSSFEEKVSEIANTAIQWAAPMCLRLAALFLRRREVEALPELRVKLQEQGVQLSVPKNWLLDHPLTQYSLETEFEQWQRIGLNLELVTRRQ